MNLIFDKQGNFILAQENVNNFYLNTNDFIICEISDYDNEYKYSYINNSVVKEDKIAISQNILYEIEEKNKVNKYREPRMLNYPSLAEQLDKLFHDINNGTLDKSGEFYKAIKHVKDLYPKNT